MRNWETCGERSCSQDKTVSHLETTRSLTVCVRAYIGKESRCEESNIGSKGEASSSSVLSSDEPPSSSATSSSEVSLPSPSYVILRLLSRCGGVTVAVYVDAKGDLSCLGLRFVRDVLNMDENILSNY